MGTDPSSNYGGVSFALQGYLSALKKAGLPYEMIPTHRYRESRGKYRPWLKAMPLVVAAIRSSISEGMIPIVYCHAGAAPSLIRKFILLVICKWFGAKTVLQIHSIDVNHYLCNWLARLLFKAGMMSVDLLCVLTLWWKERLIAQGIHTPIIVIPNPLPEEWERRSRNGVQGKLSDGLVVCSLTRLERGKGVDLVIEAMQFLPSQVQLFIAGDGSQMDRLRGRVDELKLHHQVHFMGWLNEEEKRELMDRADVFCLPSSYDSFGMGFMEAMANGLPVVALNYGPIADVVPDGRVGLLVKIASPELIAEAIKSLMDIHRRQDMSREGQRWVLEQFSSEKVGIMLRQSFEGMLTTNDTEKSGFGKR